VFWAGPEKGINRREKAQEFMKKQIEQAVDRFGSMTKKEQEGVKAILSQYVEGKIGLDEAYCQLLDEELIPMPSRCGLSSKVPSQEEDEDVLKMKIKNKML
jgi:hypothetical protein